MRRVEIRQGSVSCLPFSDDMFDLVTAVDSHYLIGGFHRADLVGFVLVTVHPERTTGEIYSLFVDLHHRGSGLGTALVAKAEEHCRSRGTSTLILYTGHSAPAVDFYLNRGFHIVGIRDPRFATKGFDLTLAKELKTAPSVPGDA